MTLFCIESRSQEEVAGRCEGHRQDGSLYVRLNPGKIIPPITNHLTFRKDTKSVNCAGNVHQKIQ